MPGQVSLAPHLLLYQLLVLLLLVAGLPVIQLYGNILVVMSWQLNEHGWIWKLLSGGS